ncbi:glycosyltransferase [Massilimicrobiota sp. An134]|uniref:glycosyltransferase n=1 Tax=Massilimicrobiota sp. An134 TaxID=1965557 RepID=UPI000B372E52|nr:glycosyltransferase [Massilimicrobiota sp. An134]
MKKIKIFLGAYVNFPNAQNVNCDNIAKYLDKDKFEVHTMYTSKMKIDKKMYQDMGIHLHKLIHHRFIWWWSKYLVMLIGNYDIYYLPKMEGVDRIFAKKNKSKICVASVEGVITQQTNNTEEFKSYYIKNMSSFFSISHCIANSINKYWGINSDVIPLGTVPISCQIKKKNKVKKVIWVGNIKSNKRPQYLIQIAKTFPKLQFKMIGDGDMLKEIKNICVNKNINNIEFCGRIPNSQVYQEMEECDLLVMTSKYEGLPKVIQEAAQMRLPCIYINENYTVDFIENGINGYAVSDLETMQKKLQFLLDNPNIYIKMSNAAYKSIQLYTWEKIIKRYEEYFEKVYKINKFY